MHNLLLQGNTNITKPPSLAVKYDNDQDEKSLDNYLWDVNEFLSSTKGMTYDVQLKQVIAYFTSSAKLWWRTHLSDEKVRRLTQKIENWQDLKVTLQEKFQFKNNDWVIRARFDEIKHMGKVHEYVRAFQVLVLECSKLNYFEKLYVFMKNLKLWAIDDLCQQRVETLVEAIIIIDQLLAYKGDVAKGFGSAWIDHGQIKSFIYQKDRQNRSPYKKNEAKPKKKSSMSGGSKH